VKTSDSDVSSETMEDWKMAFKREPIEFIVLKAKKVMRQISFGMKILMLTILTYKEVFKGLFQPSYTKRSILNFTSLF
jgi:hypothetical protein